MVYPSYLTTHITPFDIAQSRQANHPLIVQEQQRNYFTKIKNKKKEIENEATKKSPKSNSYNKSNS